MPDRLLFANSMDAFGLTVFAFYVFLVFGAPLLGYWFMVADIRAYLRAIKGALVIVKNHLPSIPAWAKQHTPGCLLSLGLKMPCSEGDVKQAYRRLAEECHPDRGGDRQEFMLLQKQFEEALRFVRED